MSTLSICRRYSPARLAGGVVALFLASACSPKAETKSAVADAPAMLPSDSSPMGTMEGMKMTGDPDRDFLRMMSDHHKGLIALAHPTMEAPRGTPESRADARDLDAKQDKEIEEMVKMLAATWQDSYQPRVLPMAQATVDSLTAEAGDAYASAFYRDVVTHHEQAIVMIDAYLPTSARAEVKAMAEQMRRDQLAEIAKFKRKAGSPMTSGTGRP